MPSGPGIISDDLIKEIATSVPPAVSTFLLTSEQSTYEIIEHQKRTGVNTIQIVDRLKYGSYEDFRKLIPGISIVQVIHVRGKESIKEATELSGNVNALLLDSGNDKLPVKELGGTGRIHNWDISRQIRESVSIPVFLAGGLNQDNIVAAVKKVRPFGVDVCSGVRTDGKLDELKLYSFIEKIYGISIP